MIESHQDYVLRGITVPANGSSQYQIPLDPDAPFALRCVLSSGMPIIDGGSLTGQALFQFTITGMDQRRYFGGNGNPLNGIDSLLNPATLPFIFYPQITFPSNITIQVTVYDLSGHGDHERRIDIPGLQALSAGRRLRSAIPDSLQRAEFPLRLSVYVGSRDGPGSSGDREPTP